MNRHTLLVPVLALLPALAPGGSAASPAAGKQTAIEVHTVKAPDGLDLRYEVAGSGEPALVFVHGWSCDRSYWRTQMDHFAPSHRVVAIDLAGHGESGLGREDWSMAAFAGDVRAVVEALGLRRVVLIGHSMGGPVIVEAARLMPDRVASVVPVDFFNDVDAPMSAEDLEHRVAPMRADFRAATDAMVRSFFSPDADAALVERVATDMAAAPPEVAIPALQHTFRYDQGAGLAAVGAPVRLINADFWPTDLAAAREHKPDLGLAVMPAVGHFVMMEEPDEFNRLLERAVDELTGGP